MTTDHSRAVAAARAFDLDTMRSKYKGRRDAGGAPLSEGALFAVLVHWLRHDRDVGDHMSALVTDPVSATWLRQCLPDRDRLSSAERHGEVGVAVLETPFGPVPVVAAPGLPENVIFFVDNHDTITAILTNFVAP